MKYGQQLGKYSVPEWHSHNILYDELKHQIKELTATPSAFTNDGYSALVTFFKTELDNTNLFVRCKLGEVEYRFEQCDILIHGLSQAPKDERLYWQLSIDVQKLNQEIRNLSRFICAQYTGFRKLLKKYRRHAPQEELNQKGLDLNEVEKSLMAKDSFARVDLTPQFLELSVLYSTLRTRKFGELLSTSRNSHTHFGFAQSSDEACVRQLAGFDVEMLTVLASDVYRFWIHADNLVQLKVLLLQNMDAVIPPDMDYEEREQSTILYMDTEDFKSARELREPAQVRQVEIAGTAFKSRPVLLVPAGGLRHTAAMELTEGQHAALAAGKYDAKTVTETASASDVSAQLALGWVSSQHAKPVTSLHVHRTRFKNENDNVWASIDAAVKITDPKTGRSPPDGEFPYAVLELRVKRDTPWVDSLRQSHLLHPVSASFSLYAWSLLRIHPNKVLARPSWLDMLDSGADIRKEPPELGTNQGEQRVAPRKSVASLQLNGHSPRAGDDRRNSEEQNPPFTRYWNEFDDGDEYEDGGGQFFDEIDEELRRARVAASLARPVYQLGESMQRQFYTWFDSKKGHGSNTVSTSDSDDFGSNSVNSVDSVISENSSLMDNHHNGGGRRYSPRVQSRQRPLFYGAVENGNAATSYENEIVRRRNDQGLALITFLCFSLSLGMIGLVFTILVTEDILMLPSGLRASLAIFLIISLALALLGYVAYSYRSGQSWASQALIHIMMLTAVCFGVGGMAYIAVPQL